MNRQELFHLLAEHYELNPDTDWWQHKQSKSWILSHDAVRKLAHQPTVDGHTIVTPSVPDVLKNGDATQGGVFGAEVVLGGEFRLIDHKKGVVRKVYAIGEANQRNVNENVAYPWAMSWKRMFDRGVLDVLAFAELNVYSAEEAATFKDKSQKAPVQKPTGGPAPKPTAPAPTPQPPVRAVETQPQQPLPPKPAATEPKASMAGLDYPEMILTALSNIGHPAGRSTILEHTGLDRGVFGIAVNQLLDSGLVIKEGEKRGTKYRLKNGQDGPVMAAPVPVEQPTTPPPPAPTETAPEDLTQKFDEVCASFLRHGGNFKLLGQMVYKLTGCMDRAEAVRENKLTEDVLAQMTLMVESLAP